MRRREFVTLLGGAAVAWPLPLRAQEAGKSYRVAYLTLAGGQDAVIVKQRLNELGYSEGKNLIFDYRSAEGKMERLPQLAGQCRGRGQSRRDRPHDIGNPRAARSSPANRRSRSKASALCDLHKSGFCRCWWTHVIRNRSPAAVPAGG